MLGALVNVAVSSFRVVLPAVVRGRVLLKFAGEAVRQWVFQHPLIIGGSIVAAATMPSSLPVPSSSVGPWDELFEDLDLPTDATTPLDPQGMGGGGGGPSNDCAAKSIAVMASCLADTAPENFTPSGPLDPTALPSPLPILALPLLETFEYKLERCGLKAMQWYLKCMRGELQ
jgi:hypothetical protein